MLPIQAFPLIRTALWGLVPLLHEAQPNAVDVSLYTCDNYLLDRRWRRVGKKGAQALHEAQLSSGLVPVLFLRGASSGTRLLCKHWLCYLSLGPAYAEVLFGRIKDLFSSQNFNT